MTPQEWIQLAYTVDSETVNRQLMRRVMYDIGDLLVDAWQYRHAKNSIFEREVLDIVNIYLTADPVRLTILHMISILRVTFQVRDVLQDWVSFRDQCADEIRRRNEDPQKLLVGLF